MRWPPKTPFKSIIDVSRLPDAVDALARDRCRTIRHSSILAVLLLVDIRGLPNVAVVTHCSQQQSKGGWHLGRVRRDVDLT